VANLRHTEKEQKADLKK